MKTSGFRRLFDDKPILLRLIATVTQQWIETAREFVLRLRADLPAIRRDILHSEAGGRVATIQGDFSDPHNGGRSVRIVSFMDGSRIVYKPKDLRLDIAWHALIERLDRSTPPVELKAVRAIARDGYGWTEFIEHAGTDAAGCRLFFRRAGAWLALLHCFAAADMHQENVIAAGDHPVPIDLETIFHTTAAARRAGPRGTGCRCGKRYSRQFDHVGRLASGLRPLRLQRYFCHGWIDLGLDRQNGPHLDQINTDAMRPTKTKQGGATNPNLPHVDGRLRQVRRPYRGLHRGL